MKIDLLIGLWFISFIFIFLFIYLFVDGI